MLAILRSGNPPLAITIATICGAFSDPLPYFFRRGCPYYEMLLMSYTLSLSHSHPPWSVFGTSVLLSGHLLTMGTVVS